jgi:plasmid stabilization system protein ParE
MQPVTYRVIISPRAYKRLNEIFDQIRRDSPANAVRVVTAITDAIEALSSLPHRYTVVERRRDPDKVVRLMPVPPYVVYYRVNDALRSVGVITVLHGHQRRPHRF